MELRELRIGNTYSASIEFKGSIEASLLLGEPNRAFVMTKEKLQSILQFDLIDFVHPLSLTPELLPRLGFEDKGVYNHKMFTHPSEGEFYGALIFETKKYNTVFVLDGVFHYEISYTSDNYGDHHDTKIINYVHELQDLHYSLNKEELIYEQ